MKIDHTNSFRKTKDWAVQLVSRADVREFIEANHYSKSINGLMVSYAFALTFENKVVGAMLYGKMAMANAWKKYGSSADAAIELRRLCLVDDTPKNTESWFIAETLRWIKKNTDVEVIVSYADPNYGHSGIIYRASNFKHIGMTASGKVIMHNGKKYHDKAIRTKYKGELKPFAKRLKQALEDGDAFYEKQLPKHVYLYRLK